MVDITNKPATSRLAKASAKVDLGETIYKTLLKTTSTQTDAMSKKGDVLTVAELAGIQAAKATSLLIPLCHSVNLTHVSVTASLQTPHHVHIEATAATTGQTGVEMEALTAASVTALTIYDMCKAGGKGITIHDIRLEEKLGGRSGHFIARDQPHPTPRDPSHES